MNKLSTGLLLGILIGGVGHYVISSVQQSNNQAAPSAIGRATDKVTTSQAAPTGQTIKIGVSIPGTDHAWLSAVKRNAQTAAADHSDVELVLTDGLNSSEKQMGDVETLIQRKVDVIVMLPHSGKALTPAAAKIKKAGIPLIVLDRMIESDDYYAYIGGDNYGIGSSAAHYLGQKLNGKGKVLEVMGLPGISVTTERHQGFVDTIKAHYPGIQLLASQAANFNADKALSVTENMLQAHKQVDAIYSHDDDMNVGVLQAVKQSGRDKIIITGAGGSKVMLNHIKQGNTAVKASFLYNPAMAGSAVNLARLAALKKGLGDLWEPEMAKKIVVRASTVTNDNVDRFIKLAY